MRRSIGLKAGLGLLAAAIGVGLFIAGVVSCGTAPTPFIVRGPSQTGNDPPNLTFEEPIANVTRDQGGYFLIQWADTDRDSNAKIRFDLINTVTSEMIPLVDGLDEDDLIGPDRFSVGTSLIPIGTYHIRGIIDDGVNPAVEVFAQTQATAIQQRVVVTIVEPGGGRPTVPPVITVTEPRFNRSVAQDDVLVVAVQPTELPPAETRPYDPDSGITIYILLDLDQDPNNDDPANADPTQIIVLDAMDVEAGDFDSHTFQVPIDLSVIAPLPGGAPYFIRATADDGTNPRVHQYAVGTISVVQLAAGEVDLYDIGRNKSGARVYGFNPGANLGSSISHIGDFDADDVADFVLVAQYGNPRNLGRVGEAYLIYGQDGVRFGGSIAANSVSEAVNGTLFEAPPIREGLLDCPIPGQAYTEGITDVTFIRDLSGDGRPEILFGCPHVHGAFESMDFDPGDQDVASEAATTNVTWVFRLGRVTRQVGDATPETISVTYSGVDDVTIDSSAPNASFGSDVALSWQDSGDGQRKWGLIKFRDVFEEIIREEESVFEIDITTVSATLELSVFNTGGDGTVFQALTDFTELSTYSSYAVNDGDPQEGVDYVGTGAGQGDLGAIDGNTFGVAGVDVTPLAQELILGQLGGFDDELRLIIVPDPDDGANETAVQSSEFSNEDDRPTLTIEYTLQSVRGARGCYPDALVNNMSDDDTADRWDHQFYAGGMVLLLNSENRDNDSAEGATPDRLETTRVALELVGQDGRHPLDPSGATEEAGGSIQPRADDGQELGHIAGARFVAGAYDCVDHLLLNQSAREGLFGRNVASIGDLNADEVDEIVISAPRNEQYLAALEETIGRQSTHLNSTQFRGSVLVLPGHNYNIPFWRERSTQEDSASTIPLLDQHAWPPFGRCSATNPEPRHLRIPTDAFEVFAEHPDDELGGARSAGDFNQDGLDDILCGAPLNDRFDANDDTNEGAVYVLYGRNILSDFDLTKADDPLERTPMLRIRGVTPGDQIGWRQETGMDVNGDRIDDVFIASPRADCGNVTRTTCGGDYNRDGTIDESDFDLGVFNNCRDQAGDDVFSDDACKVFDYDNDGDIGEDDERVLFCLADGGGNACCDHLVDNGLVAIVFGGVFTDGDRTIDQIGTSDLPGVIFCGSSAGHRAGVDVSSAGDFNQDGFGDILIAVPGETRLDRAGRLRLGVVYLIFGSTRLYQTGSQAPWSLDQVGSEDLPGIVFLSPYVKGRPNEAAPTTVAYIGDINRDGFGDICIGNPMADFIDLSFPQGPNATDAELGRRRDAGDAYIVYGNNFGSNRGM